MAEDTMPAVEAQQEANVEETAAYECAFHILPTIADEEVPRVVGELKELITRGGGTVTSEEAPERYDLAYQIVTKIDGANRRFNASHFGWVRFTALPSAQQALIEELGHKQEILRYLIVRLTRAEEAEPFRVFDVRRKEEEARAVRAAAAAEARGEAPVPETEEEAAA